MLLTCQVLRQAHSTEEASHCTSVAGMVKLLELEDQLIENLSDYANELEKKLDTVRRWVEGILYQNEPYFLNQSLLGLRQMLSYNLLLVNQKLDWIDNPLKKVTVMFSHSLNNILKKNFI